jgi:hypothetical protein
MIVLPERLLVEHRRRQAIERATVLAQQPHALWRSTRADAPYLLADQLRGGLTVRTRGAEAARSRPRNRSLARRERDGARAFAHPQRVTIWRAMSVACCMSFSGRAGDCVHDFSAARPPIAPVMRAKIVLAVVVAVVLRAAGTPSARPRGMMSPVDGVDSGTSNPEPCGHPRGRRHARARRVITMRGQRQAPASRGRP